MKKNLILKLSVIFIGLGAILTGVGFITGGATTIVKNKNGYVIASNEMNQINETIKAFTSINIDASQMDRIEIIPSDHYGISVDYYDHFGNIDYKVENDTLMLKQGGGTTLLGINLPNFVESSIKVYVPQSQNLKSISIDTNHAKISVSNIETYDLNVVNRYGSLILDGVTTTATQLKSDSTKVKVTNSSLGRVALINEYGNIEINNCDSKELNMTMQSGNVEIDGVNIEALAIINEYGNLKLADVITANLKIEANSGNIEIKNSDVASTDIENEYGNIKLDYVGTETDYNYKLSNRYGNIIVNKEKLENKVGIDNQGDREITINANSGNITINTKE